MAAWWIWSCALALVLFPGRCLGFVSDADRRLLSDIRSLKIYVYDLAGAGFMPPLSKFAAGSSVCDRSTCRTTRSQLDLCNYGLGNPAVKITSSSAPYQSVRWSNVDSGEDMAIVTHHRLLRSKHITEDPNEADLFFIPIYYSQTCQTSRWYGMKGCNLNFLEYTAFDKMWAWLSNQPSFRDSDGHDHFIFMDRPAFVLTKCAASLSNSLPRGARKELGLEWKDLRRGLADKYNHMMKLVVDRSNANSRLFPVPYATAFHFLPADLPPTMAHLTTIERTGNWQPEVVLERERHILACHIGAIRPSPDTIFWRLKNQTRLVCDADPDCLFYNVLNVSASQESLRLLAPRVYATYPSLDAFQADVAMEQDLIYTMARYCLMPPGDSQSRKGLFDAIMAGCVPVVFYPASVDYPWHLPVDNISSFALLLDPLAAVSNATYIMDEIRAAPSQALTAKQTRIAALATRVHYAAADMSHAEHEELGPDALDIILGNMWRNALAHRSSRRYPSGRSLRV